MVDQPSGKEPLKTVTPDLALHGGTPAITIPFTPLTGRWKGGEALERLTAALEQDSLFYWNGPQTAAMLSRFREHYPFTEAMPCSSGTAAIHIAVAAAGIKPGDEVIVPPITDMGTVIGILYQQGVPVFADVEPNTYQLDPDAVRRAITPRTRAIMVVHLAGNACRMREFMAIAKQFNLVVIEDCAQAWGTLYEGQPVGTIGHIGCYSLNDFKHLSCGDGGIVATNDPRFASRLQQFGDKGYDRVHSQRDPAILAPNYRMTELQAAVATAQLGRLEAIATRRNEIGERLSAALRELPGIAPHEIDPAVRSTYWFYLLRIDESTLGCTRAEFVEALQAEGAYAHAGYLTAPLYRYDVFQNHAFFGGEWSLKSTGLTTIDYRQVSCPVAEEILRTCIFITLHEQLSDAYIDQLGAAFGKVTRAFAYQV